MAAKTKKSTASAAKQPLKPAVTPVAVPKPVAPAAPITPIAKPVAAPAPVKTATSAGKAVAAAERQKMIEVAAYVLAEKNHFHGDAQKYWLQAEEEVDAKLGKK